MSKENNTRLEDIGFVSVALVFSFIIVCIGYSFGKRDLDHEVTTAHCEGYCAHEEREGRWDGTACTCVLPGSDAVWKPKPTLNTYLP